MFINLLEFLNNENTNIASTHLPNIGITSVKFTDEELSPLVNEINKIKSNFDTADPYHYGLAGHINHEYLLSDSLKHVEEIMFPSISEFIMTYEIHKKNGMQVNSTVYASLNQLWVNFQNKNEFNPLHRHSGDISFVIWLEIPFEFKEEQKYYTKHNEPRVGSFNFHYTNTIGELINVSIPADKSYKNLAVIFPAEMSHSVHPFYSDGYRISVSGNWSVKTQ
jgi:hypothetical protein